MLSREHVVRRTTCRSVLANSCKLKCKFLDRNRELHCYLLVPGVYITTGFMHSTSTTGVWTRTAPNVHGLHATKYRTLKFASSCRSKHF